MTGKKGESFSPRALAPFSLMAASLGVVEEFAEDLRCSICLELFSDPVMLECGHNYCQSCITRYWAEVPVGGREAAPHPTCPDCRREIPGGKFTANRVLGQLAQKAIETLSAHSGNDCGEFGEDDEEVQGELFFCMDDECLVRTLQVDHWGHRCLLLEEAVEYYKVSRGSCGTLNSVASSARQEDAGLVDAV